MRDDPDLGARRAPGLSKRLYVTEGKRHPICLQCGAHHSRHDPCSLDDPPEVPLAPLCPDCGWRCLGHHDVILIRALPGETGYDLRFRLKLLVPDLHLGLWRNRQRAWKRRKG